MFGFSKRVRCAKQSRIKRQRGNRLRLQHLELRRMLTVAPSFDPSDFPAFDTVDISENTGEKPQSKVWEHDDHWWSVLPESTGSWLWRLDDTAWNPVLQLSTNNSVHADVKADGDLAHILLFDNEDSQFRSLEYVPGPEPTYQPWSLQPNLVDVILTDGVETATFDIDSTGRLWLASDMSSAIEVRYADAPYTSFSPPIIIGAGITGDDISTVTAFDDNKVGVFWSNQDTERFGFRYHVDGTDPTVWSADEMPVLESMSTSGGGLADDHVNVATSSDGTIYAAVKTSFGGSMAQIGLLVRHPTGSWDPLYTVDTGGTRPIVVVNDEAERLYVFYVESTGGGDIVYRESALDNIEFTPVQSMLVGNLSNPSSTKDSFTDDLVVIASNGSTGHGKLVTLGSGGGGPGGPDPTVNDAPSVAAGADQSVAEGVSLQLFGSVSDDGLPNPPATVTTQWTVVNGPATANFANASAAQTSVTFDTPGNYVLRLTADDGEYVSTDDVNVQVTANNPVDPIAGLVGYWKLNDLQGSALADSSGFNNDAVANGNPQLTPGMLDDGLQLDGSGDYVVAADSPSLDINQQITISAWIRPESTKTQYVIKKAEHHAVDGFELSLSGSGKVFARFNQDSSGNAYRVDSSSSYPTDGQTWVHVATTYDGSNIKLYIDGQLESTQATNFQIASNDVGLGIGAEHDGSKSMKGSIDEVRIYNQALDDAQILSLFNLETPTTDPVVNQAPQVNAGSNQSVQQGIALQLSGSVSDDGLPNPPANLATQWTVVSGPGSANFANATSAQTSVTFDTPGNYVLRLSVNDGEFTATDDVAVNVTAVAPTNQAPQVNAGADRSVEADVALQLFGSVSDDGLPNPPATVTSQWTVISGPAAANFANASAAQTSVTFTSAGSYVLRLTADDGEFTTTDDVAVNVTTAAPTNQAPQVNAGADQSVAEGVSLQLFGSVSDDGLPNPPATVTTQWTVVNGPATANFANASAAQTSVTFDTPGNYVLRLTADDGEYVSTDDVNVQVTANNPVDPIAGLVGYWKLNDLQGSALADSSGFNNDAVANGNPQLTPGMLDDGLQLDGSGDYVVAADSPSLDINQQITISAWIRPESTKTQYVIKKAEHHAVDGFELSLSGSGKVFARFNQDSSGNAYRVDSSSSYPTDGQTWVHVATTYDGSNIKLYIDGQLESTQATNFQIASNDVGLGIGAEHDGSKSMKGSIDEVRIYNQALDDAQILSLFNLETPTTDPVVNQAPQVNAGSNQSVQQGIALQLSGSVSDDGLPNPPANLATQWTVVSGPGSANFANATSAQTSVTFDTPGNYVLRLSVNDGEFTATDDVAVNVTAVAPTNQAPQVNAGADRSVEADVALQLFGSVSDDGLPNPPATVTSQWTVISGPAAANFANASAAQTSVTFTSAGSYVLRLTADDGEFTTTDDVAVNVTTAAPTNQAPQVNAGADQSVAEGVSLQLFGSVSDDGLPNPPATVTTQWTVVNGPATANFANASAAQTSVTFDTPGNYVLRLTADDGEFTATDDVVVNVTATTTDPVEPAEGLVGHWKLDELQGVVAADSSGLGNNGSAIGNPEVIPGVVDSGLRVDGNGDYVVIPDDDSLDIREQITLSAWIRPEAEKTQDIIKKGQHRRVNGYELGLSSKGEMFVRFNQYSSGNSLRVDSTTTYPTDGQTWIHVAATYDGSTIRMYVNGQLENSKDADFLIAANDVGLAIGSEHTGYRSMKGGIDDVRIYNQALTSEQIQALASNS